MIDLSNVTLVCADTKKPERAVFAMHECMKHAKFKEAILFTNERCYYRGIYTEVIPKISSREDYSRFIIREMVDYVDTEMIMICQWDGYIVNQEAWSDEFLKYDYIGAPWWRNEEYNVGNGGFSMRSRRLMDYVSQVMNKVDHIERDHGIHCPTPPDHPEDDVICRRLRRGLEVLGFTFAPEEVAHRFSWEGNGKFRKYNGAFGIHGRVDEFERWKQR
ncbi:MAG TPA: DUF5672 family protein [Bacteroidales bacterium]|nr:DUF5672 family protein [Bacteroidales bacterium]